MPEAFNNDDESLKDSTKNEFRQATNENISSGESGTANPHQDTENMEVHHHGHHHGTKTWKSYFWEFLMLFLALCTT